MKKLLLSLLPLLTGFLVLAQPAAKPEVYTLSQTPEPDWSRHAAIYEVNVRQYTPEGTFNAFGAHLPRLRDMGVDILWFMPIHPIGVVERKGPLGSYYSVQDYRGINPEFGTMADFKRMVARAHGMNMKVIIDWVPNHTSRDHPWISQHPDWYVMDDKGSPVAPFDWTDVAKLNYDMYYLRKAMIEDMRYWLTEADIDGFRCDVAGQVPVDFWEEAAQALRQTKPNIWMLAEDADELALFNNAFNANYEWPFHHVMNAIAKGEKPASAVFDQLHKVDTTYPKGGYAMQFITNHDENSWNGTEYERLGGGVKAFSVLYYTVPGIPLIYSGQEAGLNRRLKFFEKDLIDWKNKPLEGFYTQLNQLKSDQPALWNGRHGGAVQRIAHDQHDHVVAFSRSRGDSKIVTVINLSDKARNTELRFAEDAGVYREYFTGASATLAPRMRMNLGPWEYKVYIFERPAPSESRGFKSMDKTGSGLRIRATDGTLDLNPLAPYAVEVAFTPHGDDQPEGHALSPAVEKKK